MNPKCFIIRGVPGSGKTELALLLALIYNAIICSANRFFEQTGVHLFVRSQLSQAHAFCRQEFLKGLERQQSVIVDNTHTMHWEYEEYTAVALKAGYDVVIVELVPDTTELRYRFFHRQTHGVVLEDFERMRARWQHDQRAVMIRDEDFTPGLKLSDRILTLIESKAIHSQTTEGSTV